MTAIRPIRLVTFDLYDTLVELTPQRWERAATALKRLGVAVDVAELRRADVLAEDFYTVENGRIPVRDRSAEDQELFRVEYMRRWLTEAGLQVDHELAVAARHAYRAELDVKVDGGNYRAFDDVVDAAARLREAGVKRAIISNADADVTAFVKQLEIAHEMDLIVTSAVIGYEKPDIRTYRAAFEPLGIDPADALHIGDQPSSDVIGALNAGMQAALIDRYKRHDPAAHAVPVFTNLHDLVDYVLSQNARAPESLAEGQRAR